MITRLLAILATLSLAGAALGAPAARLVIIIDDLGYSLSQGKRVATLPGPVACAILPDTPSAAQIAELAHAAGKEVMLHLPMQSMGEAIKSPDTLAMESSESDVRRIVKRHISTIPFVSGINNHQGSLLTRHPDHMDWLMAALADHQKLYFVDSYTTHHSVAVNAAAEHGVRAIRRHVFLDSDPSPEAIANELQRAIRLAHKQGFAVAIGHPYPATLDHLERALPELERQGIRLISPGQLLRELNPPPAQRYAEYFSGQSSPGSIL